jgi:hypothetical protein
MMAEGTLQSSLEKEGPLNVPDSSVHDHMCEDTYANARFIFVARPKKEIESCLFIEESKQNANVAGCDIKLASYALKSILETKK